jgi:hypothetical protein
MTHVFAAQSIALVVFGLTIAGAVAGGAWFGPVSFKRKRVMP